MFGMHMSVLWQLRFDALLRESTRQVALLWAKRLVDQAAF